MAATLDLLCAGAAQGLVTSLQARFLAETGAGLGGRFGAVGAMKEALEAGEACDVMVVTDTMVNALIAAGALRAGSNAPLGRVRLVQAGEDPQLMQELHHPDYSATVERAFVITIEGYDWNCPQHITPRFTEAEVTAAVAPLHERIRTLEAELAVLRQKG